MFNPWSTCITNKNTRGLLVSSMANRATGVGHVVHENGDPILHVPNQHHAVHLVGLFPLLVDQGKVHVQPVRYRRDPGQKKKGRKKIAHVKLNKTQFVSMVQISKAVLSDTANSDRDRLGAHIA